MRLFGQFQKVRSRKLAVASSSPFTRSGVPFHPGRRPTTTETPHMDTFVAAMCCKRLRLATHELPENFSPMPRSPAGSFAEG